ncbi:MAG: HEPN domain-containing protein [Paludibacter sp.]|jgi:HEPN domain-containing protein|nr:HEPN domain-containing protein [Paludibacter sp.]
MTTEEKVAYWVDLSDEDFRVANGLLTLKHYLYVGFMCHQCIEKIFKAVYEYKINDTPPFVHDLLLIINRAGIFDLFDEKQIAFLEMLSPLNIRARYPDYKRELAKEMTKSVCENIITQTKTLQQWTKKNLLLIK